MLLSDIFGTIGSLCLAVPPLKDQFYRLQEARQKQAAQRSPAPPLRRMLAAAWRNRRDIYSGWDSLWLIGGAAALALTFVLKLAGK